MIEIIPAIIPQNFEELTEKMTDVLGSVEIVQIDVLDGVFTKSNSWPYNKVDSEDFRKIIAEEEGFPYWKDLDFEVDLMVSSPVQKIPDWIVAGARRIVVHFESLENPGDFLDKIKEILLSKNSIFYTEIGIAINIETPNSAIYPLCDGIDFIQCMGIKKIGYQGEKFDEEVLLKISDFRERYPELNISVDGGVNLENARDLINAGANRLVVGSALYGSDDIASALEEFQSLE